MKRDDEFIPRGAFLDEVKGFRSESGSRSRVLQSTGETISCGAYLTLTLSLVCAGVAVRRHLYCVPRKFPFFLEKPPSSSKHEKESCRKAACTFIQTALAPPLLQPPFSRLAINVRLEEGPIKMAALVHIRF